jgi:hypothetical protein
MMIGGDEMALKALLAAIGRPGWAADAPRMMIGVGLAPAARPLGHDSRQCLGDGRRGASRRPIRAPPPARPPGGCSSQTRPGCGRASPPAAGRAAGADELPAAARSASLLLSHSAQPAPWATVSVRAAVPLTAPAFAGYRVSRQVTFLERKRPDRLSAGDVLKVGSPSTRRSTAPGW